MKRTILHLIVIGLTVLFLLALFKESGGAERVWVIHKPAVEIVKEHAADLSTRPLPDIETLLPALTAVDIELSFKGRPQHHYYVFKAELVKPYGKLQGLSKSLEVWGQGKRTVFRSKLDIEYGRRFKFPFRWVNCVIQRIIDRVEAKILFVEEQKIRLTN